MSSKRYSKEQRLEMLERYKNGESAGSIAKSFGCYTQKEIRDEERTIKQLEAQKADMERLEDVKRKREALSEEERAKQVDRVESRYRLTFNGVEINKLFATEEEAFTYAEAASDNNYFEAEVRRIN